MWRHSTAAGAPRASISHTWRARGVALLMAAVVAAAGPLHYGWAIKRKQAHREWACLTALAYRIPPRRGSVWRGHPSQRRAIDRWELGESGRDRWRSPIGRSTSSAVDAAVGRASPDFRTDAGALRANDRLRPRSRRDCPARQHVQYLSKRVSGVAPDCLSAAISNCRWRGDLHLSKKSCLQRRCGSSASA